MDYKQLEQKAAALRREVLDLCHASGRAAHAGPALSCMDIVTALYYHVMRFDAQRPDWELRDRFILSKGHACPAAYAVLADMGIVDRTEYQNFRHLGGVLQGHMTLGKTPGVDMTAGSLGNGLGIGLGMAYYLKLKQTGSRVYVILGDGELNEGTVWEAVMQAPACGADNLTAIVDVNGFQSCGATDILPMAPLDDKWRAFGWEVISIDGHNMEEILAAFDRAKASNKPAVILAHTVKGKGVSFMEHNNVWHQAVLTDELYAQAIEEVNV